ncbi:aspartate kinase [Backusella circina FSU 941]|nr:aspartate kinase [Backusella circina FSU 941]
MLNPEALPWVVQKYGGTSVGKFLNEIADTIVPTYLKTNRVAIVCSARSGNTKKEGTTNRLLQAAEEALKEGSNRYLEIVDDIREDHLEAARSAITSDKDILADVELQIQEECLRLCSFLEAAEIINEISPRSKDIIVGMGEKLACIIVCAVLKEKGIDSQLIVLNNIIDKSYQILDQDFYDHVSQQLQEQVKKCGNKIPVLTGFFGNVPGSLLISVGRGYTDLCAALLAVGLKSQELQIWKEVDGIFTADPRKVSSARLLDMISPEEAAELTYYGSEVIHPLTMEQVIRVKVPIRIKNVENPLGTGTVVFPDDTLQEPAIEKKSNGKSKVNKYATAVTVKDSVCVLNIHSNRKNVRHGFFAMVFTILDKYNVVADLVSTSEVHVSMALSGDVLQTNLEKAIQELGDLGEVDLMKEMAIISLVGKYLKKLIGAPGIMFTCLAEAGISIEIISQGASEINISCVVAEIHALEAIKKIHERFLDVDTDLEFIVQ